MTDNSQPAGRRQFLKNSMAVAGGAVAIGQANPSSSRAASPASQGRLPREVWIGTLSIEGMRGRDAADMTQQVLEVMRQMAPHRPDVICLPETFLGGVSNSEPLQPATGEIGEVLKPLADFAQEHHCHVVCPVHTRDGKRTYNSAVFIDRQGKLTGSYHKIHTTTGEMGDGILPGPTDVPVFDTDIGKLGAQICFDIEWSDGWQRLAEKQAEIVFWPSAFGGGAMVNSKAWQHQYCVVSSTHKGASKICDVSGEELAATSRWNRWVCAAVNLEKAFLHTWPYVQRFDEIHAKYGRDVRIRNFADEEWSILESRSPDIKIADVLKEFELKTMREHLAIADEQQRQLR